MTRVWAHTHLPRLKAGEREVISLKAARERVRYVDMVKLRSARFHVSEKGRQRTLATGRRNVHAWVIGDLEGGAQAVGEALAEAVGSPVRVPWRKAVYDPFKGGTFVDYGTLRPVYEADEVMMIGKDVYYR